MKIDPTRYGTATETSVLAGIKRTTLLTAVNRGEIACIYTAGGGLLIDVAAAKAWKKVVRVRGRKAGR